MTRRLFLGLAVLVIAIAASMATLTALGAGPLASDGKPPQTATGVKGPPLSPAPSESATQDGWTVVPPELRSDVGFVDVTEAQIFLPRPPAAAACGVGELDPPKAEAAIRGWLRQHRGELAVTRVWDQTIITVTCKYPSSQFPGKVVLYIGVPNVGYSYAAPPACQEKMRGWSAGTPLPEECELPADAGPATQIWSYTIVVDPQEVLR